MVDRKYLFKNCFIGLFANSTTLTPCTRSAPVSILLLEMCEDCMKDTTPHQFAVCANFRQPLSRHPLLQPRSSV